MSKSESFYDDIITVRRLVSKAALYEQLAEECAELAQASLKMSRKIRNENYTPKTMSEIEENIIEEFSDIFLCSLSLGITESDDVMNSKLKRWIERNSNNTKD